MAKKIQLLIKKMTVNAATFKNESVYPTLINYFYGKNGSGKSTISREMYNKGCFDLDCIPEDYEMLVYNEDFIEDNISSYGNIPGVFSISKENKEVNAKISELEAENEKLEAAKEKASDNITDIEKELEKAEDKYKEACWRTADEFRSHYPELLSGAGNKRAFMAKLNAATASNVTFDEIIEEYKIAFGGSATTYDLYKVSMPTLPTCSILSEVIVGSASTPFADFIKAVKNTAWVQDGHTHYQHDNKCPYCQQKLPDDFEKDFALCFDDSYNKKVEALKSFKTEYVAAINSLILVLMSNLKNPFANTHQPDYELQLRLLKEQCQKNIDAIDDKIADPAITITLDELDLSGVQAIIEEINKEILETNKKAADIDGAKKRCINMTWSYIADKSEKHTSAYEAEKKLLDKQHHEASKEAGIYQAKIDANKAEIKILNEQHSNTDKAMESINALLNNAGFKGFQLQKKPHAQFAYQLVRLNGDGEYTVVKGKEMSEGERHFLAFLYFYHQVVGTQNDTGRQNNKVVVIDDPVSSMDSSSLFAVASLVRNLVEIAYNNFRLDIEKKDNFIKQIFILTHNPYFFKEVSYNHIKDYECASFFEIKKDGDNKSTVSLCTAEEMRTGGSAEINVSPVRNTYDALWEDFKKEDDPLLLLNTARQILEYYFLQICGYDGRNLKEKLIENIETPLSDNDITIATAMLNLLNLGVGGFGDGLYFDVAAVNPEDIREVLRLLFDNAKQSQHYNMMMKRS